MKMSENPDSDVVIIGAGVAGCLVGWSLARQGVNVTIVEAGPWLNTADVFERFVTSGDNYASACYPSLEYAPRPMQAYPDEYHTNVGPATYNTDYVRAVGGTTWHWGGAALRFMPNEMKLKSNFGVGRDWPIEYSELERFYTQAEVELGVSGNSDDDLGSPRSQKYPMPEMPATVLDQHINNVFGRHGIAFHYLPQARNSVSYDGRPACQGNNICSPVCPINAKYTGDIHARKAINEGAKILADAMVTSLEVGSDGQISSVQYRRPDGSVAKIAGKIFVLAANAIETVKLLLNSTSEAYPNGLANSSDQVGRNLMGHTDRLLKLEWNEPVYPGTGPTLNYCSSAFRDGPFRSEHAGAFILVADYMDLGGIVVETLDQHINVNNLETAVREKAIRRSELLCFSEELPIPENRITLDHGKFDSSGQPGINIHFSTQEYADKGVKRIVDRIWDVAVSTGAFKVISQSHDAGSVHITGTTIMGENPVESVVDSDCRSHDHPNLFFAGSGSFPSSGTVNPTLTIAALSLRTAEAIKRQLA